MIATILFIVAVYRLVGGLAAIALVAYGLISYAALLAIGATLTLPGLAGFVLAIGMAVDANVLVFETGPGGVRGRAEIAVRGSMTTGFTQRLVGDHRLQRHHPARRRPAVLPRRRPGAGLRGDAVSIGVLASMFTALVLTRVLTGLAARAAA